MSSTNTGVELENAYDGNPKTYIHSEDGNTDHAFQTLKMVFGETQTVTYMRLAFWRWGDDWCDNNLVAWYAY